MTTKTYAQLGTAASISAPFLIGVWDPAGPGPLKTAQASVVKTFILADLGTAADADTGTSGHVLGFLDGANTWSATQTFSGGASGNLTGNVTGSSGSCTGNAATATLATTAGTANAVAAGAVGAAGLASGAAVGNIGYTPANRAGDTFTGTVAFANNGDFNLRGSGSTVILQMTAQGGINYNSSNDRLNIVAGGVTVGYFDSTGYHTLV